MKPSAKPRYVLDGKPVFAWLFAHVIAMPNGRRIPQTYQVEGFSLDHAFRRLMEHRPQIPRREWQLISDDGPLEPEHDCGYLGEKLPLFPNVTIGSQRIQ